jgi:toxin HigB-1
MIGSFRDKRTRQIFDGDRVARMDKALLERARRRLQLLNAAAAIEDLYFPPSNKFKALEGYDPTRYAIRVNDRWRISFEWVGGSPQNVCFEDYH